MGKEDKGGKGERRRRVFEENNSDDLLMIIDTLSPDNQNRLLIASEEGNEEMVNAIVHDSTNVKDMDGRLLLKKLCDRKIGDLFKKCKEDAPSPTPKKDKKGKEDKAKGKGERHRRTVADNISKDVLARVNNLSSNDKKRVLIAAVEGDEQKVDSIFENSSQANDVDGRFLLKKLCDRKIGGLFKKCKNDESPTPAPKMDKKKGKEDKAKGKGERHRRTFAENKSNDLLALVNSLSSEDKNRVLIAAEEGDEETVDFIFENNSSQANDLSGRYLLKKLCDRKIGGLFKKCKNDEAPTPAPKKGKMSKEDKAKGKGERHRRTWEGKEGDDLVMFIDRLSLDDKKRLLSAIGSNDEATVDSMFDNFV